MKIFGIFSAKNTEGKTFPQLLLAEIMLKERKRKKYEMCHHLGRTLLLIWRYCSSLYLYNFHINKKKVFLKSWNFHSCHNFSFYFMFYLFRSKGRGRFFLCKKLNNVLNRQKIPAGEIMSAFSCGIIWILFGLEWQGKKRDSFQLSLLNGKDIGKCWIRITL